MKNSEPNKIVSSLSKLAKLDPTLNIYAGHGDKSILGKELKNFPCKYFTGHCTGKKAFEILKGELGEKAEQLHVGLVIEA